ncbi:MAG: hypothetical protein PF445_09520 [Melioribacteraceae bacterium]|jgi:hypothetical protein|nr:hypothetical protein [Melioribacteraceae bacterium]
MKTKQLKISLTILILSTFLFTFGCSDGPVAPPNNEEKVTITQGAWGTVRFLEGDFMPYYDTETGGTISPVVRDIYIHEATTGDMVVREGYGGFYKTINSQLIAVVQSNENGFFQIQLDPGKYSFFILEDSLFYGSRSDGEGFIMAEDVLKDSTVQVSLDITYMAVY